MKCTCSFFSSFRYFLLVAVLMSAFVRSSGQTLPCIETNGVKFILPPQVFDGLDVKDSREGIVLADDFPCLQSGPITDIHLWGSWLSDQHGTITNFWLAIYNDVPAMTNFPGGQVIPSHPGTNLLWQQSFGPGQYAENIYANGQEYFYNPSNNLIIGGDTLVWYYCFYPTNPFVQTNGNIYWLAVRAQIQESNTLYGWKSSLLPFQDAAVWGNVQPGTGLPISNWQSLTNPLTLQQMDLSFKLTTPTNQPPEPCCPETNGVKWVQWPDLITGIDYSASLPFTLADDFRCTNSGLITDIHLWGSWLFDAVDYGATFTLAIWSDIPSGGGITYSQPGTLLWSNVFYPGTYTICPNTNLYEPFNNPDGAPAGVSSNLYYLCFFPDPQTAFHQAGTANSPTNYWLSVTVQPSPSSGGQPFGWKSSTNRYNDTAVWTAAPFPPPTGAWAPLYNVGNPNNTNVDFAFKITTDTNNQPPPPPTQCVETNGVKYQQIPDLEVGVDVWNNPYVLADDFVCTNPGPITDIHIWGSWITNRVGTNTLTFWLGIYEDVPISATNPAFSYPGKLVWQQWFAPGQYAENLWGFGQETFLDPGPPQTIGTDTQIWYYCFYPTNPLVQLGTSDQPKVYWLAAYAQLPSGSTFQYGWKSTYFVQQDVSVHAPWPGLVPTNNPGWLPTLRPSGIPLDLAFKLTTPTNDCPLLVTCSADKTVECDTNWFFDPPIIVPNPCCTNPPFVTFSATTNVLGPCQRIITGVWVITDCLGQTAVCTQNVTVVDTTPPVITCASNKTVECGSAWTFDPPTAVDNCSGTNVMIFILDTQTNGNCPQYITRFWMAVDLCGNTNWCSQTVTVEDTTPPVITCPSNIVVFACDPGTAVLWSISAFDDCSPVSVFSTPPSGTVFPVNTTNVVVATAVDACSNSSSCAFLVTVLRDTNCPVVCVESDYEKYVQWPRIIGGFDVWNNPYVLADDFVCTNTGPISDIHLWGSWQNDAPLTNAINFWLGIYDDVPAFTNVASGQIIPSHPGTNLLWQQWFAPGQYAETIWAVNASEQFLDPGTSNSLGGDSVVWYYCFYPTNAFEQTGTPTNSKIYWLAAYAQLPVGQNFNYGWKTATNQQHDVSVHAIWPGAPPTNNPGWTPTSFQSPLGGPAVQQDLAFKLTMCGPVNIRLVPTNHTVVLTWLGGGYLQSATNVLGPYIDVPGLPTSPYTESYLIPPTNRFYRIRCYP